MPRPRCRNGRRARGLTLPSYDRRLPRRPAARAGVRHRRHRRGRDRNRDGGDKARGRAVRGGRPAGARSRRIASGARRHGASAHRRWPQFHRTSPPTHPRRRAAASSAIVGAPNAGKSTLLNRLTGAKLSIVSPKAQTTRFRVLGILMRGATQILLVDTPGIFAPRRKLDRAMVAAAWTGAQDADLVLLLVDAKPRPDRGGARASRAASRDAPGSC